MVLFFAPLVTLAFTSLLAIANTEDVPRFGGGSSSLLSSSFGSGPSSGSDWHSHS